jgi:hypothetical protein
MPLFMDVHNKGPVGVRAGATNTLGAVGGRLLAAVARAEWAP